ncbi:MAG: PPC domain-containing DNA-binding protein [Persicimonas sp.]
MIFQETTRTRRLVGRIEEGEDLVESLTNLCRDNDVHAGQLQAVGSLSRAEVARFDAGAGQYRTAFDDEGLFDLVSLSGNVSRLGDEVVLRLEVLLSAMGPAGPQVLSGQLRSGISVSCEFVLEIFEDLEIERRLDADSGRLEMRAIRRTEQAPAPVAPANAAQAEPANPSATKPAAEQKPAAEKKPIAGKGMSWKDAAGEAATPPEADKSQKASKSKSPSAEELYADVNFEEALMQPGDILEHPKLGRCRVMKVEEGDFVHVRLPRGRIRKLSLEIVDVSLDREEGDRRIFKAKVGR